MKWQRVRWRWLFYRSCLVSWTRYTWEPGTVEVVTKLRCLARIKLKLLSAVSARSSAASSSENKVVVWARRWKGNRERNSVESMEKSSHGWTATDAAMSSVSLLSVTESRLFNLFAVSFEKHELTEQILHVYLPFSSILEATYKRITSNTIKHSAWNKNLCNSVFFINRLHNICSLILDDIFIN